MSATAIVAVSVVWGWRVQSDPNVKLGAAPLVGQWHVRFGWSLVVAAAIAAVTVVVSPRFSYRQMLYAMPMLAVGFALSLAASDGLPHVLDPVVHPTEYWGNLATLPPAGRMLHDYGTVDFLVRYSVHAKGHPPGFLLVLKGLDAIGLGRPWVAGALSYLGIAFVPVAVLETVRRLSDRVAACRIAPFLVVTPYMVWMGTSADAFYAAVGAGGVLLIVVSRDRWWVGFPAGVVLGALLFGTYGGALFLLLPAFVLFGSRRAWLRPAFAAAAGGAVVTLAFRLAGFWWFDGATTTKQFYWWGTAHFRPWHYFLIANLGAAVIAVGPATVVALGRLRDRRLWLIVGGALVCIVVADLSQYSKAEVERIWLIFYPWLIPAVAVLPRPRRWLGAQAMFALALQTVLVSKW